MFILQQNYTPFCVFFSEKEKGQNTKQSCYRFILCPLLYGAFPSLFGNLKRLLIGYLFSLPLITFSSIRFGHYSVIYLMERRSTLRPEHSFHSISVSFHSIKIHYVLLPIPKLSPLSFQRKHAFHRLTMPLCRAYRQ